MNNKKIKILVVEDEISLATVLFKKFKKEGFEVLQAKDGQDGLEIFLKERPDLILLDLIMPIMDGMEMLKKLRRSEEGKEVPIIILSNVLEPEKTAESLNLGVCDYLVKSDWTIKDLVEKVKQRLRETCGLITK